MSDFKVKFELNGCAHGDDDDVFQPPAPLLAGAHVRGLPSYHDLYRRSINDPDTFWKTVAAQLYFETSSERGLEYNFDHRKGDVFVRFMAGAKTNIAYNCLERNIAKGLGSKIAYKWEGNEPDDECTVSYQELLDKVIAFSTVLRSKGVRKGDVVAIYLPMVIELPVAMLACARIGAIHSVVFAARIVQAKARVLVTADGCYRATKTINLKGLADHAVEICQAQNHSVEHLVVLEHLKRVKAPKGAKAPEINWRSIDCKWEEEMQKCKGVDSSVEWNDAEDPLFILYTSGSTGAPKGIVHSTAGYMVTAYNTTRLTFDVQPDTDILWTTADCGWITGHSYVVYGPLLNGLTSVIFEGVPSYPNSSRMWAIVEKYNVTKLYTAPTAVRALMGFSDELVQKHDRSSLKIIGTVGEPINPSAWKWLYTVVGEERCAVVDTYWQTETGGHVIAPLPGATPTKPGSATLPFVGVQPAIVDAEGRVIEGPGEGNLCFSRPWPGMMRTVYGDHKRYVSTYFSSFPGFYFTGDGSRRDQDGYYWITGRVDDLMNVSGHLLSTAEIESALVSHSDVVEAAVVAAPHDIKGQFPYAFVTLSNGHRLNDALVMQLKIIVREKIGAFGVPDIIQEAPGLPKTRSGKVTRRILRKIAEGDLQADLGDTTTLVDESVIGQLWQSRPTLRTG
ncbi:AMP-binding enzyme domain-containing protein [Ditylenchus destructor]|nr:AMP-binding enzyme domain-containing protein [Ditylenchus destructor]